MNKIAKYLIVCSVLFALSPLAATAMSVDWGGAYRLEFVNVEKTTLTDPGGRKSYLLNHLNLAPKIIVVDGINVVANLEIFPNTLYNNSQLGQSFGTPMSDVSESQIAGGAQKSSQILVNQLYINVNNEYGSFLAGRTPLQFGLGMTHNAGKGLFDHWLTTHNVLAYKFIIGNLSLMPVYGRISQSSLAQGTDASELIWNLLYDNPETESAIGIFHQTKTASKGMNDAGDSEKFIPGGTAVIDAWKTTHTNLYLARGWEAFKFRMEAGFDSGATGVSGATGEVQLKGYGVAIEMDFPRPESKWQFGLRTGMASGDDPKTNDFEGYTFSRNYDLAFLLFNHPMGGFDIFTTNIQRHRDATGNLLTDKANLADEETVGNTMYFSPRLSYHISDKWEWTNTLTWAQLQSNSSLVDISKEIGFELDMGFTFKPHEKVRWVNEIGFFFPGAAWAEGSNNRDYGFTYGFQSKAAISF